MADRTRESIRGSTCSIDETAKVMRKEMTVAESKLWNALRGGQLGGLKFRRQHPIGNYILDFCCADRHIAIEVDGEIHDHQKEHDSSRTEALINYGYIVLRFRNDEVLHHLPRVIQQIHATAVERPTRSHIHISQHPGPRTRRNLKK